MPCAHITFTDAASVKQPSFFMGAVTAYMREIHFPALSYLVFNGLLVYQIDKKNLIPWKCLFQMLRQLSCIALLLLITFDTILC